jgi:small ligand-binding sensory domain FIST
MKWATSLAVGASLSDAVARAADEIRAALGEDPVDLVLVFVSHHHREAYAQVPDLVQEHLPARCLAGCSGGGVLAGGVEEEGRPALALAAARLPGVDIGLRHLTCQALPDEDASPDVWRAWVGTPDPSAHFVVMADPFSTTVEPLLTGLDYAYPASTKVGGMASGGRKSGENALFFHGQMRDHGLVLLTLGGNVVVDAVVAQGCRPVGQPLTVTRHEQNVLMEVNHQPPLRYLGELVESMSDYDRQLMRTALFLGLQVDEPEQENTGHDFLIRNLVGIDYQRGVLAVSAPLTVGQRVQFHLRDKATSSEDLHHQLNARRAQPAPAGALLFSCLGRGRRLYGEPHYDSRVFHQVLGDLPLAGFFGNGEIGPVGSVTHLHGYTSAFALIRPATPAPGTVT